MQQSARDHAAGMGDTLEHLLRQMATAVSQLRGLGLAALDLLLHGPGTQPVQFMFAL